MRKSGILLHLSSLPSPYGIGTMGKEAYQFVDFLKESGQSYWQLLPICPTSYGDSPYQSYSTYAGNPYFIDLDLLAEMGLLQEKEYQNIDWECSKDCINYGVLYLKRYHVLRIACERFLQHPNEEYKQFCNTNDFWLSDFSLFMTLKDLHEGKAWQEWEKPFQDREKEVLQMLCKEREQDVAFWKVVQYLFYKQWFDLKEYANSNGISVIGDLPIYVSLDSVDVWAHGELFQLDENKMPKEVAGCPPDGFSENGQLWGNPLFDWDYMEQNHYEWWVERIRYLSQIYNTLRIDHFRGFDSYYAIPYGATNAKKGCWRQGPGMKLFHAVKEAIGQPMLIAEDLGFLTDSVRQLLKDSTFPGMKVMEFAFDSRDLAGSDYLPYKYYPNCVAYTGTHDNDTILGWYQTISKEDAEYVKNYLRVKEEDDLPWSMMASLWESVAMLTIVQAQDVLGLGSEARMNTPATLGNNWCWRALPGSFSRELAHKLKYQMRLYGRLPEQVDMIACSEERI